MDQKKLLVFFIFIILTPFVLSSLTNQGKKSSSQGHKVQCVEESSHNATDVPPSVVVAKWNWNHVGLYLTITGFIVLSGLAKVGKAI